ncbi:MAG TPA: hypothetical protein VN493_09755 [Thermoanaerobaculia bacterium]|nr:hypothetical protein [Thermoanaerobaculia bacterium]
MRRLTSPQPFRLGLFLALAALALATPSRAALNRWSSGGPFAGGPVTALAFDPANSAIVYAGTYSGVFRSEDHGATWTAASLGLASGVVFDLAADPASPGTLYVATGEGVQKSLDHGRTWGVPSLTAGPRALALDPSHPQTLYSAVLKTIHKSINGGATWTAGQTLPGDVIFLEVDPAVPAIVYAGTPDDGLFRSVDSGTTWSPVGQLDASFLFTLAIDPGNSQVLYAGTTNGVFKSTDRGTSWFRHGQGLAGQFVQAIEVDPASPSTLLALGSGVFRSTDAGGSWRPLDPRFINSAVVAFDPGSSSTYFVGSSDGVYKSADQGISFHHSSQGITASVVTHLAVDPHRPGSLLATVASATGSLYRSADAGASWSHLPGAPANIHDLDFDPKKPSVVYAATGTGIYRSQDGGANWVRINFTEAAFQLAIDPRGASTMYLSSFNGGIRKSLDGGNTWTPSGPDPELTPNTLLVVPSDPDTVYAASFSNGAFRSTDGGETWTDITGGLPTPELNTLAVDPRDANVVYAGVLNDRIYKSTNGGATWFSSGTGLTFPNVDGIAVDPSDSSRVYASNSLRGIFRSTNGGASWTRFDEGVFQDLLVLDIVIDPVNPFLLYAVSYGGGVLARADLPTGPGSLRLNGGRFLVAMSWATGSGLVGRGQTQALTGDTGYAWFFQSSNVEVLLKVLDGCGITGHFWVFAAGLTDVRTDITVADTRTGVLKIYHNPPGQPFQPIQDTSALACSGAASMTAEGTAQVAAAGPVLLRNGRFRVTAEFATAPGTPLQPAEGAALTDDAAYLWFFDQSNVEVFLKVVDGCLANGRFWVFAAGLTDVEVRITVEDTKTGEQKVYINERGTPFRPVQDTSTFEGCS